MEIHFSIGMAKRTLDLPGLHMIRVLTMTQIRNLVYPTQVDKFIWEVGIFYTEQAYSRLVAQSPAARSW